MLRFSGSGCHGFKVSLVTFILHDSQWILMGLNGFWSLRSWNEFWGANSTDFAFVQGLALCNQHAVGWYDVKSMRTIHTHKSHPHELQELVSGASELVNGGANGVDFIIIPLNFATVQQCSTSDISTSLWCFIWQFLYSSTRRFLLNTPNFFPSHHHLILLWFFTLTF